MNEISRQLEQMRSLLDDVLANDPQGAHVSDQELVESTVLAEEVSRLLDVVKVRRAGEIAWRSRRQSGRVGLAESRGHGSGAAFLRSITRSSYREASRRIRVGTVINEAAASAKDAEHGVDPTVSGAEDSTGPQPPLATGPQPSTGIARSFALIAEAVAGGALGVEAANSVLSTLTPVVEEVNPEQLVAATATLVNEARAHNTDEVGELAREIRDTLDRDGVADRQAHLRSKRSLQRGKVIDGLRKVWLVLDPESDVRLIGAIDAIMSPRLGGPRFSEPAATGTSPSQTEDPRTNEQIALDTLVDLVTVGVQADPATMPGGVAPAVRVTMTARDLLDSVLQETRGESSVERTGVAILEGHPELVSAQTARRYLCNQGALPIILSGESEVLDLGRSRRLFTSAQRVALAVRDGGCRWPHCDRPPSWTESHHIVEYQHGGRTDLKDGIALCRRHHLLLHNNGWSITRRDHTEHVYWLRPPKHVDPAQELAAMPTKARHIAEVPARLRQGRSSRPGNMAVTHHLHADQAQPQHR